MYELSKDKLRECVTDWRRGNGGSCSLLCFFGRRTCAHCHMCPKDELKKSESWVFDQVGLFNWKWHAIWQLLGHPRLRDLLALKCINVVPPRKKRKTATKKPPERRRSPRRSPRRSRPASHGARRRPDTPYEPNGDSYRAYYERAYGTPPPHPNPYYYPPPDPRYPPPAYGYPSPYGILSTWIWLSATSLWLSTRI